MITKKGKRVFGAIFSKSEKKAMEMEIGRQIAEYDKRHKDDLEALILWELHCQFGFGQIRLKRFYDNFSKEIDALISHYELDKEDNAWICKTMLRDIGVDIDEWSREADEVDVP